MMMFHLTGASRSAAVIPTKKTEKPIFFFFDLDYKEAGGIIHRRYPTKPTEVGTISPISWVSRYLSASRPADRPKPTAHSLFLLESP